MTRSEGSVTVADFIAGRLVELGVRHVFGVGGANIEDLFAAVQRRRPAILAVLCKHEHGAGTAADAYARVGHGLGVVLATSGGGTLNLVHSLAEARASRVPVLAVVGEPPSELQGHGAFQDTSGRGGAVDAARVLRDVTKYCARVEASSDVPWLLSEAVAAATGGTPGPAVLLIAKDRQTEPLPRVTEDAPPSDGGAPSVDLAAIRRACALLEDHSCLIIAGDEAVRAGTTAELAALSRALGAPVAVTPDGRDAFDNHAAEFVGVAGGMGHPAVAEALRRARVAVVVGTRLPLLARQGLEPLFGERALVSLGREPPFVESHEGLHVPGDLRRVLHALLEQLGHRPRRAGTDELEGRGGASVAATAPEARQFGTSTVLASVERAAPAGSVLLVDAGNTGAAAVHALNVPPGGRWLIAMGMAGMGWAFGAAIGAALASDRRCFVLAGDGAFFMHGFEIHTALEHRLPITFVIFNNRAHGMCLVRERLLLHTNAGYNSFRPSHLGAGLAAMFPGLDACDCTSVEELERALDRAASAPGPSVVVAELDGVEVPPFAAFQAAGGAAFSPLEGSRTA